MARANPISSRPARHVAHLLDPGDGAVETLQVVLVGGGELTRQVRELELDQVADLTELGQLVADLLLGAGDLGPAPEGLRSCTESGHVWDERCKCPLSVDHETMIRTSVCRSIVCPVNFQRTKTRTAQGIRATAGAPAVCEPCRNSLFPVLTRPAHPPGRLSASVPRPHTLFPVLTRPAPPPGMLSASVPPPHTLFPVLT